MSTINVGDVCLNPRFVTKARSIIHTAGNLEQLLVELSSLIGHPVDSLVLSASDDEIVTEPVAGSELQDIGLNLVHAGTRKEWHFQGKCLPRTYYPALFALYGAAELCAPYLLRAPSENAHGLTVCTYSRRVWVPQDGETPGCYTTAEGIVVQRMPPIDSELADILHLSCSHVAAEPASHSDTV